MPGSKIEIIRPTRKDTEEVQKLFEKSITNNFKEEGILASYGNQIPTLINDLSALLAIDFKSEGAKEYHLIAKSNGKILGIAAFGKANPIIVKQLNLKHPHLPEVKSVYILPEFQGKGIGSRLFQQILKTMKSNGFIDFYLDTGYAKARQFWTKKLGQPILTIQDYWGPGSHHMIWKTSIASLAQMDADKEL